MDEREEHEVKIPEDVLIEILKAYEAGREDVIGNPTNDFICGTDGELWTTWSRIFEIRKRIYGVIGVIASFQKIARHFISSCKYDEEVLLSGRKYRQTLEYEMGACAALCHNSHRSGSVSDERWKLGYSETIAYKSRKKG